MSATITGLERVVVTGMGLVTPLGVGVQYNWRKLCEAKVSGVKLLTDDVYAKLPCRLAAVVPETSPSEQCAMNHFSWSLVGAGAEGGVRRQMSRAQAFAIVAGKEAWVDSGLNAVDGLDRENIGVAYGQGIVDLDDVHATGTLIGTEYCLFLF
jgi:3-oxoacyl-[acyl-carrier-protein] synthase II